MLGKIGQIATFVWAMTLYWLDRRGPQNPIPQPRPAQRAADPHCPSHPVGCGGDLEVTYIPHVWNFIIFYKQL